jgi:hypothetical protein
MMSMVFMPPIVEMLAPGVLARLGGLNDEIGIMRGICGGAEIGVTTDTTRKLRGFARRVLRELPWRVYGNA